MKAISDAPVHFRLVDEKQTSTFGSARIGLVKRSEKNGILL